MKKKMSDAEIWNKEWYMEYSLKQRSLLNYIFDNCDSAGIFEPNYMMLSFYMHETVTRDDILSLQEVYLKYEKQKDEKASLIEELPGGKFWVVGACYFQCGVLSIFAVAHKKAIETLYDYGLLNRVIERYKEKDRQKEKEKIELLKEYAMGSLSLSELIENKNKKKNKKDNSNLSDESFENFENEKTEEQKKVLFTPESVEVVSFCKDYVKMRGDNTIVNNSERREIARVLSIEGEYNADYWQKVFQNAKGGYRFNSGNGEIKHVPCSLSGILSYHGEIYRKEKPLIYLKPKDYKPKENDEPFVSEPPGANVKIAVENLKRQISGLPSNFSQNNVKAL